MSRAELDINEPLLEPLTRREREILGLWAQGFSAPEIAEKLFIALSSVKWHIQHLYDKLGVNSKREALNRAAALGLLAPAPAAPAQSSPPTGAPSPAQPPPAETPPAEPPFKGLRHFDASDADLFFGREHLVAALVARLRQHPFLAVVGASGSGKSSVVRAGLVPALAQAEPLAGGTRPPPGSADWPLHLLTPTAHPLEALAASLTRDSESVTAAATLLDDLAREPRSLRLAAQRMLIQEGGARLLLVVDQFEEVFTLCREEAERKAFIDNLLAAVEADGPVAAVLTLRADFYAHCVPYPQLRAALEQHQAYIGPMDAAELRRAIEAPAAQNGYEWEPGLVDLILRDAGGGDEPGALPLLSHALLETWKRRRGRTLAFAGYREAGGVRGAIANTAQSVYEQMTPEQQAIARRIFLRLTELGEGTRDTRRRAALPELLPSAEQAPTQRLATETVLRTLAAARLVTLTANTAEVAHEAVLQEWPALREWLNENRDGLRLHRRLTEAAQSWERSDRDPGELFRGARLAQTLDWATWSGQPDELTALEREFLDASTAQLAREEAEREAARQRELEAAQALAESQRQRAEAERARAEEQTHASRRLRQRSRIVTGIGLVALALAAVAGFFAVQANRNAFQAERAVQLSLSRQLILQASSLRDSDHDLSLLLNVEALRVADTIEARSALLTGLQTRVGTPHVLGEHTGPVSALALSPDGAILATAASDKGMMLWDLVTRQPLGPLVNGHTDWVSDLAFSRDGRMLASIGRGDQIIRVILWDVSTRQPHGDPLVFPFDILAGHPSVAFSPNGNTVAASFSEYPPGANPALDTAEPGLIRLWDVITREPVAELLDPTVAEMGEIAFSPDGHALASVNNPVPVPSPLGFCICTTFIKLWNLDDGQLSKPIYTGLGLVSLKFDVLTYSRDGSLLALVDGYGSVLLYDLFTKRFLRLQAENYANTVAFSPNDRMLATGEVDGNVRLWDLATFLPVGQPLARHVLPVTGVAFTPDGDTLASAGEDGLVILWDLTPRHPFGPPLTGHTTWVNRVAFSPDGQTLASGGNDGEIRVWNTASYQPVGEPLISPPSLGGLAFSPDGRLIASGGRGGALILLDAETRQPIGQPLAGHTGDITGLAFSPDGKLLASASLDKSIRLWDVATGQSVGSPLMAHTGGVMAVAFSPDGKILASGSRDKSIRLWDVATSAPLGDPLTGHTSFITSITFAPDGATLASGSGDGSIRVWEVATHEAVGQPLSGHTGPVLTVPVLTVAISPDGALLASGGVDNSVRLWDLATQRPLGLPFSGHESAVNSVAFRPDGTVLASGSNDATVLLWDMSMASWQVRACAAAGRNLTQAEWNQYVPGQPYHATCAEWPAGE